MSERLTAFEVAIALMGSAEAVARICGVHRTSTYNWQRPALRRRAGDLPSAAVMRCLLDHARENGIPLTADHLIFGAKKSEIDALTYPASPQVAAE